MTMVSVIGSNQGALLQKRFTRGFEILYLPVYSLFLNGIELFWSKLKAGVRRELLTKDSSLTSRIIESAK